MRSCLIGHTGLVGTNLKKYATFSELYNSKNIEDIRGEVFDLAVCAGARGTKWIANQNPKDDWKSIQHLISCLRDATFRKAILVSSVDVYPNPVNVDEGTPASGKQNHHYGRHRYLLEEFWREEYPEHHIIRLPIIFGERLQKNMIFDLMNRHRIEFLDPDRMVQIFDLSRLYRDMEVIVTAGIPVFNFGTEPISIRDVARKCFGIRLTAQNPYLFYNVKTRYCDLFGRKDGYIYGADDVVMQIIDFVGSVSAGHTHPFNADKPSLL